MAMPKEYTKEFPLCSGGARSAKERGRVRLHSSSPYSELEPALDGLFVFCLYFTALETETREELDEFLNKPIVLGLELYMKMLHDPIQNDKLSRWGAMIYTHSVSYKYIRRLFPVDLYPKVFIAVVVWPYYTVQNGVIEESILRCMRHHGKELFPNKTLCTRDADTLFELAYYKENREHQQEMITLIRKWELSFLNAWLPCLTEEELAARDPTAPFIKEPIVLGRGYNYSCPWHIDVPFPTPYKAEVYKEHDLYSFYMKHPNICFRGKGLYAGFVNVAKSYTEDLWTPMMEYLLQRYFIVEPEDNPLISDVYNTVGPEKSDATNDVGKDEKLLIFVYARLALDHIYIMYINYNLLTPLIINPKPDGTHTQELLDNSIITPGYVDAALRLTFRDINRVVKEWHAIYAEDTRKKKKNSDYKSIAYDPYFGGVSRHNMNRGVGEYFKEEFMKLRNAYNIFLQRINRDEFYQTIDTFLRSTQEEGAYFYKQKAPSMKNIVYKNNSKMSMNYPWPRHTSTIGLWRRILGLRSTLRNQTNKRRNTTRKL